MSIKHFSLDIETLGSSNSPVLLSIGLYEMEGFEEEPDVNKLFTVNVDVDSCLRAGLNIQASNLKFWMKQGEESRKALYDPEPVTLITAIGLLGGWYSNRQDLDTKSNRIWSHATFDIPRLDDACTAVGLKMPWSHRDCRDIRTIVDGIEDQLTERKKGHHLEHTCGWDAFAQGQQVLEALDIRRQYDN